MTIGSSGALVDACAEIDINPSCPVNRVVRLEKSFPRGDPRRGRTATDRCPNLEENMRSALLLVFAAALAVAADGPKDDKDEKIAVRALKFAPADPAIAFTIGGQNKVTPLSDADAVEKLVGKESAQGLIKQVSFEKETIVLVSWSTGGPPEGTLKHEVRGMGKDRKLIFFVQGPPNATVRGERLRLGADFLAVPRNVAVSFDPKER